MSFFNINKNQSISYPRNINQILIQYNIKDVNLSKYLGVVVDDNLKLIPHTNVIKNTMSQFYIKIFQNFLCISIHSRTISLFSFVAFIP